MKARNGVQEFLLPILASQTFQLIVGIVILLNAFLFGLQVHHSVIVRLEGGHEDWENVMLMRVERVFLILFVFEVVVRLLAEQWDFFVGIHWKWNLFESSIVVASFVDLMLNHRGGGTISSLRTMRLFRAVRIIRVFRFLRHLRMMLFSMISCLWSLMWALLLLLLVVYVFALYFEHAILFWTEDNPHSDPDIVDELKQNWSGMLLSMRSLVYAITGGADWA